MISDIYKIENRINHKKYIGLSVDILDRWQKGHKNKLGGNRHENSYLQNAWNKYGAENFTFVILEDEVEEESLLFYGKKMSEQFKRRLSESRKGMVFSKEHKLNLSRLHKGLYCSPATEFKKGHLLFHWTIT